MENGTYHRGLSGQLQQSSSSAGKDKRWFLAETSEKTMAGIILRAMHVCQQELFRADDERVFSLRNVSVY